MKIQVGQTAPDFTVNDIFGNPIKLSAYKGKKIVLGFFRNVNCPFCNRRVHQLILNSIRFKNNDVQLIFLFESSADKLIKSSFHKGVSPWPLIGNPQRTIYDLYGAENSLSGFMKSTYKANLFRAKNDTKDLNLPADKDASMTLMPADFFIDENFKIVKAHYGKHLDDHVDYKLLSEFAGIVDPFENMKKVG